MKEIKDYLIEAEMGLNNKTREDAEIRYNDTLKHDPEVIKFLYIAMESYAADRIEEYKKQLTE